MVSLNQNVRSNRFPFVLPFSHSLAVTTDGCGASHKDDVSGENAIHRQPIIFLYCSLILLIHGSHRFAVIRRMLLRSLLALLWSTGAKQLKPTMNSAQ